MIENATAVATAAAAVGTGLTAGMFLAFSIAVMPALRARPHAEAAATMQEINIVIVRPAFLTVFFGSAVAGAAAVIGSIATNAPGSLHASVGLFVYIAGCVIVTAAVNVPLNNVLAPADPTSADGAVIWTDYLTRWTRWNHIRTAAAAFACTVLTLAAVAQG